MYNIVSSIDVAALVTEVNIKFSYKKWFDE